MLSFFKSRKTKKDIGIATIASRKALQILSAYIQKVQHRIANYLSELEQRLSYRQKQLALTFFFISMICMSLYPVLSLYLQHKMANPAYLKFKSIKPTISTALPDSLDINYLKFLKAQYEFERRLKDSADSIKH